MDSMETQRLETLVQYGIAGTPPEPNFDRITLVGAKIFGTSFCTINLVEAERLWIKSHYGIDVSELPRSMSFCDYTIRSDAVMVVPDATSDARFAASPIVAGAPHIRFYAGAPLITPQGHRIGTLCLLDTQGSRDFSDEDATILANLAATTMELIEARSREMKLATLTRQVSYQARHDALTGLSNRRDLTARAHQITSLAGDRDQLALLYVDLDGFKTVNDTHGHGMGDQLLVEVAKRLSGEIRESDSVARVGGDEFVMLLPGTYYVAERAQSVAARLLESMAEPFLIDDQIITIGASIGIVVHPAPGADLDTMLHQADSLLYQVKARGKGQYILARADDEATLGVAE